MEERGDTWVYNGLTIFEAAMADRGLGYIPGPEDYANPNIEEDIASTPWGGMVIRAGISGRYPTGVERV